jgi:hypothetical protein
MSAIYDGTFTTGTQDGPRRPSYPFANAQTPDVYAAQYDRELQIHPVAGYRSLSQYRTSYTNLLTYSDALNNAAWTKTALTVTDNAQYNPNDGTASASLLTETAVNSEHRNAQPATVTAAAYTLSAFFSITNRPYVRIRFVDSAAGSFWCRQCCTCLA